jgi:hypothetical protein
VRKRERRAAGAYHLLRRGVLGLLSRGDIERLAWSCGFYVRQPREIRAFEFCLCCALAAALEAKRSFASIWRLLGAAAGVDVARSAVTQRFGAASAALLDAAFHLIMKRLPVPPHPELLHRLEMFDHVLADDGSVLALAPVLKKLFPATRTNIMPAAGKLHATADLVHRQVLDVELTGERTSERDVARARGVVPRTMYIRDLGYTDYNLLSEIQDGDADFLMRLKDNANPTVVKALHGVRAPRQSRGQKLNDVGLTKSAGTFGVLAEFKTTSGPFLAYVVGIRDANDTTGKYHCYVTSLPPEVFTPEELAVLYSLRWVIELLFKVLKSSFHLDHLDTASPDAVRTHIYASLVAAVVFSAVAATAASSAGVPPTSISTLTVGIAAPLLVVLLLLLWLRRRLSREELAAVVLRTVAVGCRDQNPNRTRAKWNALRARV